MENANSLEISTKFILGFFFGDVEYSTIALLKDNSKDDFDIDDAIEVFKNYQLSSTIREMYVKDIPAHFLPSIIISPTDEALVLLEIKADNAIVLNPTKNIQEEIPLKNFKKSSKILLIFRSKNDSDSLKPKSSKAWFSAPLRASWRTYVEVGILTFFINIFALAIPLFVMSTYDRVIPNKAYSTLFVLALGAFIILIFDIILKYARNHILEDFSKKIGLYWEEELMRKMILANAHFDHFTTGTKANLFKELHHVRDFFTIRSLMQVIDLPFFFIALLVIYIISPAMAAVPLIFSILIIGFNILMQLPIAKLGANNSQNLQSKNNFIFESIQGTEAIKASNALSSRMFLWKSIVAFTDSISMRIQSLHMLSMNISQFMVQLVVISVVVVGVFEIADQKLSIGGLIAITILASRAIVPIVNLSGILIRLKEIGESVNRIDEFLSIPSENATTAEAGLGKIEGKIEFKNVSYKFQNSKYSSLENISFTIAAGEKVGIIGQTGAGKSTIAKLILKTIAPSEGSIYLDNHELSTLHPVEVRENIGIMLQDPFLFNGSIKENIGLFKPISKSKMMEILKTTGLEELIKKAGKGDSLQVGERGSNLSVGQRHLVALARSLVNNPSILILDEPTTGLDMGLEKRVIEKLKTNLDVTQTLLIITHRLAALELVDRLIVINDGKIVADGPKEKVLQILNSPQRGEI
ncbi:MAG TPA: type I secretion system permease/ATPase [Sulfurimonas sp.]|uniref:type I secretion system permease/ATPase n=1 Tax=Sulfurimonas sp. TaxID=2022749 RepID=UPI002D00C013|nr:type I secretion system permease/ATPase [Sulfurimonas sp.]HUH43226.1 type I secretion system permease/ATPase [Sulfurimonas sp.]